MANKRSFDNVESAKGAESAEGVELGDARRQRVSHTQTPSLPVDIQKTSSQQPPHKYMSTLKDVTRFYARKIEGAKDGVLYGVYPVAFKLETFACSQNTSRPCLTLSQLSISPDDFMCGIAYSPKTRDQKKAKHVVDFTTPEISTCINDVQAGITGSVSTKDIEPFRDTIVKMRDSIRDFYTSPMQFALDGCGDRDAFMEMLRRTAQREAFEETGLFGKSSVFEFVTTQNNFAIFKVNVSSLSKQPAKICASFVEKATGDFFLEHKPGYTGRGRGLPFKIQLYIYGTKAQFKECISGKVNFPSVGSETDIAGLVIFRVADVEQFKCT